jgi:hypothetical protein
MAWCTLLRAVASAEGKTVMLARCVAVHCCVVLLRCNRHRVILLRKQATFLNPMDVKLNRESTALFVADYSNHTIRRVDLTVFAPTKDGTENGALVATLVRPDGNVLNVVAPAALCVDAKGAIYVACKEDHTVRKVMPSTSSLPGLTQPTPRAAGAVKQVQSQLRISGAVSLWICGASVHHSLLECADAP